MSIPLVRLVHGWSWPDLRQTPGGSGLWDGIQFTNDPLVTDCDYVIVQTSPGKPRQAFRVPPDNVWYVAMEPPNEDHYHDATGKDYARRTFMQVAKEASATRVYTQVGFPWHVNKSYDELTAMDWRACPRVDKPSWITSNKHMWQGHRDRLRFLDGIRKSFDFDLFGRGFTEIEHKEEQLFNRKYTIVVENFANPVYFTEKLTDAFLAGTLPFYWGCTEIEKYFPAESMIRIDISDPAEAVTSMQRAIRDHEWEKRQAAIEVARDLVLNRYQFFPLMASHIHADRNSRGAMPRQRKRIDI